MKIFKRIRLELKSLRGFYWLPVGVLFVLLPLFAVSYIPSSGLDGAYYLTVETTQWLHTLVAPWWSILLMKPFFHSDGKELLLLYNERWDNLFLRTLCASCWYLVHILILMIFFAIVFSKNVLPFFAVVAAQTLFINGLCYLVTVFCRNTFIPILLTVCYCIVFGLMILESDLSVFLMNGTYLLQPAMKVQKILTALISGGVFFAVGVHMEHNLCR